jgi:hypothetical protein
MKYEFDDEIATVHGVTLRRIKALIDFSDVKKGDLGGFIESVDNLSQYGNSWVYHNAKVFGNAKLYGDAVAMHNAYIYGNASVCENARVVGDAEVRDDADVHGNAIIRQAASVSGAAEVFGNAVVDFDLGGNNAVWDEELSNYES